MKKAAMMRVFWVAAVLAAFVFVAGSGPARADQFDWLKDSGRLNIGQKSELTIADGAVTVAKSFHSLVGEGGAADTLETISGGNEGDVVYFVAADAAANITLSHGTGNIVTSDAADFTIPDNAIAQLIYDGSQWRVIADINIEAVAYGVRWDADADTYVEGIVSNGDFVSASVDSYPIQERMRRCVLADDGTVAYYLCDTDSTLKADCATAANIDGTDGQVMVEVPAFYYVQTQYGDYRYFFVASGPFRLMLPDGSEVSASVHPAFTKAATAVDYRYIGAYNACAYDDSASDYVGGDVAWDTANDVLASVSGVGPAVDFDRGDGRAMAENRGAGWHLFDAELWAAVGLLYVTEYADFDAQDQIGAGRTALSDGDWTIGSYLVASGLSNNDGNGTNSVANGGANYATDYMTYRGIEHWYGHIWQFIDGANIHNATATGSRLYLSGDYTAFDDDTDTGYDLAGSLAETDGYVTDIVDAVGFWAASVGGSSATYLCDYYYTYFDDDPDVGWRVARVGGYATYGSSAGPFFVNSYSGSSSSTANFGGRLCF